MKHKYFPEKYKGSGGFTLVEVLVVIAVVTLLMAITFPVFAQSRQRAHQVSCLSNIRQVGMAILAYTQDNDEVFPNGVNQNGWGRTWPGEGWAGACFVYLHSTEVFHCPIDATPKTALNDTVVSYAINNNVVQYADGNDDPIPSGFSLSNLAAASHTVLLFEVSGVAANVADLQEGAGDNTTGTNFSASGNGLDNRLYAQKDWSTRVENQYATGYLGGRSPFDPGETQFASPEGRHETGANYLLADGHTRLFFGRQISSGHNAFGENCHQDNIPPLANCGSTFQAAGTADAAFAATFSIQ